MPNCNISSGRASSAIRIRNSCVVTNGDIICFCGLRAGTISDTVTAAEGGISSPSRSYGKRRSNSDSYSGYPGV
nr:MAG TPA: hypothetical protein [Caudoviricetes sp.]